MLTGKVCDFLSASCKNEGGVIHVEDGDANLDTSILSNSAMLSAICTEESTGTLCVPSCFHTVNEELSILRMSSRLVVASGGPHDINFAKAHSESIDQPN